MNPANPAWLFGTWMKALKDAMKQKPETKETEKWKRKELTYFHGQTKCLFVL